MKSNFEKALAFTLKWEGGITDHPKDPGKLTIYGISMAYWPEDVAKMVQMSDPDRKTYAMSFYHREFWTPLKCDDLPNPLDMVAFDSAINLGLARVKTYLDLTHDWRDIILFRIQHYSTKKGSPFLGGWINRCVALWNLCKKGG